MNQDIERELSDLAKAGRLTPDETVEKARNPQSAMHGEFEWDDSKAAHQHRLDTARQLIRSARVSIERGDTKIVSVAYVRHPTLDARDQGYVALAAVTPRSGTARDIMLAEMQRVVSSLQRARTIASVLQLDEEIDAMLEQATHVSRRANEEPATKPRQKAKAR
jgi:hypothetical protein